MLGIGDDARLRTDWTKGLALLLVICSEWRAVFLANCHLQFRRCNAQIVCYNVNFTGFGMMLQICSRYSLMEQPEKNLLMRATCGRIGGDCILLRRYDVRMMWRT